MKINLNDATICVIYQRKREIETNNIQNTICKIIFTKIYIKFDTRFYQYLKCHK